VVGGNFLARDITFQNIVGASKHLDAALRVGNSIFIHFDLELEIICRCYN